MPLSSTHPYTSKVLASFSGLSLLPAIGISLFRLADWAMFDGTGGWYDVGVKFASRILQVLTLVIVLILDRRIPYSERTICNLMGISALGSCIASAVFLWIPSQIAMYVSGAFHGMFQTILLMGWGYYLCLSKPKTSAFELTLAFAIFGLCSWVFSLMPRESVAILLLFSPLFSYWCLVPSISRIESRSLSDTSFSCKTLSRPEKGLLGLLLVCCVISMFAHCLMPTIEIEFGDGYRILWPIIYISIFLAFFVWLVILRQPDPNRMWPIFVIVILSGLICYTSFVGSRPSFANDILASTQMCSMLFSWVISAGIIYQNKLPRVFSFGLVTLVCVEPITLVITIRGAFFPEVGSIESEPLAIGVTLCMALALIVLTILLLGLDSAHRSRQVVENAPRNQATAIEGALVAAIGSLAGDFALTKREQDVALCLASGYTLPHTAERLGVSLDTVRSHVKCLYRKTGIHKKQQLIELIEIRKG